MLRTDRYGYAYDHNGNIVLYVSETGSIAAQYTYDPCGNIIDSIGSLADGFSFGFSTKYHDRETGMVRPNRISGRRPTPSPGRPSAISRRRAWKCPRIVYGAYRCNRVAHARKPSGREIASPLTRPAAGVLQIRRERVEISRS